MWYIFFVLPCALIFFLSTFVVGFLDDSVVLQTAVLVLLSFLLLPAYYDQLPRKWRAGQRVRTHVVFSLSVIMLLNLAYVFRLGVLREKSYDYRFAYHSGPFRAIYSVAPVQYSFSLAYAQLPLKQRMRLYQAEDVARVFRMKNDLNRELSRSVMCRENEKTKCFLQVVGSSVKRMPLGTAGTLALYETGAAFLKEDEELYPNNHLLHVKQSADLNKLVAVLSTNPDTELSSHIPGFPDGTKDKELLKLLRSEKKARFMLSHQKPLIRLRPQRAIAGK